MKQGYHQLWKSKIKSCDVDLQDSRAEKEERERWMYGRSIYRPHGTVRRSVTLLMNVSVFVHTPEGMQVIFTDPGG